jgi:hypothetical protein
MPPGRRSLSDEVTKYAQRKHEWLKWILLEHVRTGFVNVEDEGKKKLLLIPYILDSNCPRQVRKEIFVRIDNGILDDSYSSHSGSRALCGINL